MCREGDLAIWVSSAEVQWTASAHQVYMKGRSVIQLKRVYSESSTRDGVRILIDRVWPRGMSKKRAKIDEWRKDLAPTTALRKWFAHDPMKWAEFRRRYRAELRHSGQMQALDEIIRQARSRTITLVYSAADEEHNQAVVLKELLEEQAGRTSA